MSLIYLESFDNIATADLAAKGWTTSGTPNVLATVARTGPNALQVNAGNEWVRRVVAASEDHATFIVGCAFHATAIPSSTTDASLIALRSDAGATAHVTLALSSGGGLNVRRGEHNGTVLGTAGALVLNTWYFIELKATLSDTVGTVDVRVNGVSTLSLTGQDTKNAGTKTVFDSVLLGNSSTAQLVAYYDDVYFANGAGTVNNNFLGDLRVRSLAPSGNGNSSQLLGSDANSIDNYLLVDDPTPDTADYVGSATLDQKDTYAFGDLPDTSGTVLGVQVNALATKTDTGVRNLALVTRSGAADYDSADVALTNGSNLFVQQLRELDPATAAAWTRAAVNAAEFGVKVR